MEVRKWEKRVAAGHASLTKIGDKYLMRSVEFDNFDKEALPETAVLVTRFEAEQLPKNIEHQITQHEDEIKKHQEAIKELKGQIPDALALIAMMDDLDKPKKPK